MLAARGPAGGSLCRFFARDILKHVEDIISERVRPVLKMDGGDVIINSVKDGIVTCTLTGHCSGCPSRRETLTYGILQTLQEEIPEIKEVKEKDD